MKSLPIKNTEDIERIKNAYKEKGSYGQLLLFLLAINTGLKFTDLLNLKVSNLQNKNYINLSRGITLILSDEIKELISMVSKGKNKSDYIFTSRRKEKISRFAIYKNFKGICAELNIYNTSVESWRKTFGYHHYKKYHDLFFLQWYFGQNFAEQAMEYIDIHEQMSKRFEQGLEL